MTSHLAMISWILKVQDTKSTGNKSKNRHIRCYKNFKLPSRCGGGCQKPQHLGA